MKDLIEQMKMVFDLMASDEFVDSAASFAWKMYGKLKEKGFTDEQAIQIVISMNGKK